MPRDPPRVHTYAPLQTVKDYMRVLKPIEFRPASADEAVPYLADPAFSSCTVPIIWYSHWYAYLHRHC